MTHYKIHQLADLVKARGPKPGGGGWTPTPMGWKRPTGKPKKGKPTKWEYGGYGTPEVPPKAPKRSEEPQRRPSLTERVSASGARSFDPSKKKAKRPSPHRVEGRPMESFASTAPKGSAKHRLESGEFSLIKKRSYSRDADKGKRSRQVWAPNVDDQTRMELIEAYQPLIKKWAKKLSRQLHLPFNRTTLQDLQQAGAEGMLVAIDKYKGGTDFNPTLVVRATMRVHAASEFLGFEVPEKHAENLSRYIAARHQASQKLDKPNPTPEEVLPFFDLRKRHLHSGLPAHDKSRPLGNDKETGKMTYATLRNEQLPDFDKYTLPEHLGRKGTDDDVSDRVRKDQLSKFDWAEIYHNFLTGQKGFSGFDQDIIAPGVGIGQAYSAEDRAAIQHDLAGAADAITSLGPFTLQAASYPGAKKKTTYRVKDLGKVIFERLMQDPGEGVQTLVESIPIHKLKKDGKWERVGDRQAHDIMTKFVHMGMQRIPKHAASDHTKRLLTRAAEVAAPSKRIPPGPSWADTIRAVAAEYTQSEVSKYRESRRTDDRASRMSDQELRIHMAQGSRTGRALSAEMRRSMLRSMEVERTGPTAGLARIYNQESKQWESIKVHMNRPRSAADLKGTTGARAGVATSGIPWVTGSGAESIYDNDPKAMARRAEYYESPGRSWFKPEFRKPLKKSYGNLSERMLRDLRLFPNLMKLLMTDGPPTKERAALYRLVGLL